MAGTYFYLPDGFTVSDAEFIESKQTQEAVYRDEGKRQAGYASYVDQLGHARWDTDYVTLRMAGYTHEAAMQEMRIRIRAAWQPPLPNSEPHPPVPVTPPPPNVQSGVPVGKGGRATYNGTKLPLPDMLAVVKAVFQIPGYVATSCQDAFGGNWNLMNYLVDTLRTHDSRFGFNGKRGNAADPSKDAVAYHYGDGPDENSTDVYIIDVINGHCGPTPSAAWNDVTDITISSGTIGRWTSRGRF